MLINDPGWRGEAALRCGFVDTVLGRVGVKPSLERESFPPSRSIIQVRLEDGTNPDLREFHV